MTTATHNRLSLSALAAASSLIAFTAPAHAQSVCSAPTSTTFTCTLPGASGTTDAGAVLNTSLGQGLVLTTATTVTATGTVTSSLPSAALIVIAPADLSLTAVGTSPLNATNTGTGAGALIVASGNITNVSLGALSSVNAPAFLAQGGLGVKATTGAIATTALNTATVTIPASAILSSVTGVPSGTSVSVGSGAAVISPAGNASITAASVNVAGSADPLVGIISYAPAGTASTTVTGNVAVTKTLAGNAIGAGALGSTGASVSVGGATSVIGTDEASGLSAYTTTGPATVTTGGNLTVSAADATGVNASTTTGLASVTLGGNVAVSGSVNATGINASGDSIAISGPNATITATDTDTTGSTTDAIGITAQAVNGIAINTGKVVSSGSGVVAVSSTTTGSASAPVSVTVKGVQAGVNGIVALGSGATPVTVTATAPVTVASTGSFGIVGLGANGLVTVNEVGVTGATGGVLAVATGTGSVAVNATGGTTTATSGDAIRAVSTGGATTVTVASGATVTGQGANNAILVGSGTGVGQSNTVNIAGTVNNSGTGASLRVAGGPTTVNLTGALSGPVVLGTSNDIINVNSGGSLTAAAIDFGAGTDTLKVNSGGTLSLSPTSAFTGLEVLNNAGTVRLAAGTNSLAGVGAFTNTGTVSATGGVTVLTGLSTFTNNGTISMVDGQANDTLTLGTVGSPTNFVGGAGSRLAVDVTPTAADRLVITGTASGQTVIAPSFIGAAGYNPTGVTVVTTTGTVANGAFIIDPGAVAQGWLNAGLTQTGGVTRLTTTLDSSVADLAQVRSLNQDMWYQSFDAWDDAVRGRHAGSLTTGQPIGIWGQLYRSRDRHGDSGNMTVTTAAGNVLTYTGELKTDRGGAQVGLEFRGPGFVIGATGGYEWANNRDQPTPAVITGEGHNWGLYALAGMDNGLYAGVLYKRDNLDLRFFNPTRGVAAYYNDAHSEGVDGEIGLKGATGTIGFDLQGGLSWVKTYTGTFQDQGLYMSWNNNRSLRGRLGGRVIFPQAWGAYLGAKVIHEFRDPAVFRIVDATTGASAADIVSPNRGTWVRLEAGIDSFGIKGALLSVWGDVGETKSLGARLGFRF